MNLFTAAFAYAAVSSSAAAQLAPGADVKSMACEDLAVAIAEAVGGATSQLAESQRLAMKNQPSNTAVDAAKSQALGIALNAIPGQAGALAAQAVGMAENAANARKDAERQRDEALSARLEAGADEDLDRLDAMLVEQERRCAQ